MRKIYFLFVVVLVAMVACKPSAKNELNKFNNMKKAIASYDLAYPAFASYLDAILATSQKAMDEAMKITAEEKKAEAMQKANQLITAEELYRQISSLDGRIKRIEGKKKSVNVGLLRGNYSGVTYTARDRAITKYKDAKALLENSKPTNKQEALENLKEANGALINAEKSFDLIKKIIDKKNKH